MRVQKLREYLKSENQAKKKTKELLMPATRSRLGIHFIPARSFFSLANGPKRSTMFHDFISPQGMSGWPCPEVQE